MDIRIDENEGNFKFRVCGILKHNGKYLVVKMNKNKFYCLPGGHVELNEDTNHAVLREMREELDFEVKIKKLIAVNQNFFSSKNGKQFHEIGYYYIVEPVDVSKANFNDYTREELDGDKIQHLEFKWFTLNELNQLNFQPSFILECLDSDKTVINITRN
jgi:ADP-ribose pyrophosphatase YjhB (NUDIX family)